MKGAAGFVTLIIRIGVIDLAVMDSMGWETSLVLPDSGGIIINLGRSPTMLQGHLTAFFEPILTYERTATLLVTGEVTNLPHTSLNATCMCGTAGVCLLGTSLFTANPSLTDTYNGYGQCSEGT